MFLDKQKLIELGLQKKSGKIDKTWDELAEPYGIRGEMLRDWVKKKQKKDGTLSGKYEKGKTKILVISDQHYPFNLPIDIYKDYTGKIDILVINGDEQDSQGISRFRKKYRVPFVDEMIGTRQMLIDIINLIKPKRVLFNKGNHNIRLINYFSEKIHEDLLELMPETNLDFICDLGFWQHNHKDKSKTFYEPLTKVFEDKIDIIYTKNWYNRIGNSIIAHPSAYKGGILATSEKAYLHFLQKGENPFDCLVLSHTHAQGLGRYGNTFLIETGACCQEMEYVDGKLQRPQAQGYFYMVQDKDGKFLYDESKLVCIT